MQKSHSAACVGEYCKASDVRCVSVHTEIPFDSFKIHKSRWSQWAGDVPKGQTRYTYKFWRGKFLETQAWKNVNCVAYNIKPSLSEISCEDGRGRNWLRIFSGGGF